MSTIAQIPVAADSEVTSPAPVCVRTFARAGFWSDIRELLEDPLRADLHPGSKLLFTKPSRAVVMALGYREQPGMAGLAALDFRPP